ncbi:MAG: BlaI/MecI/CopY family transcriptional regulator [Kineosporiaceae bacterium]|nr:BlaI/MecI/CopY family transcriptional regulator [Kineosporiaceae bacterium]
MAREAHLERAVLEELWQAPDGASAVEICQRLPGRPLAQTTVLTVLDRLRRKGLVQRERIGRSHRFWATVNREVLVARTMLEALSDSTDHALALSRFVDGVPAEDVAALRRALDAVHGPDPGRGEG